MNQRVFISYAKQDAADALAVCRILENNQISYWIAPRDIPPAAEFGEAIVAAIESTLPSGW